MSNLPPPEHGIKCAEFKHWNIYLHPNQCYLGRCYLWALRENAVDFMDMTDEEWFEFREVGKILKQALSKLFSPDLFNYASLGNTGHHLHIHFIPRYSTPRIFDGVTFADIRWGKNYAPYEKDFYLHPNTLQAIAQNVAENLHTL